MAARGAGTQRRGRTFDSVMSRILRGVTLEPREKQLLRRTQVWWYPTHEYQLDQPSQQSRKSRFSPCHDFDDLYQLAGITARARESPTHLDNCQPYQRWPSAAARDQHPSSGAQGYLRNMLSRCQLQGFVGPPRTITNGFHSKPLMQ